MPKTSTYITGSITLPLLLVFVLGSVFILLLLVLALFIAHPTEWQIFLFRVVLSLSAAGISALIPGLIKIELPLGVKAAGAFAVLALVYLVNPPQLLADNKPYDDLIRRGESALANHSLELAEDFFHNARQLDPQRYEAIHGLARISFRRQMFSNAAQLYLEAASLKKPVDGELLYMAGWSLLGADDYTGALDNFLKAEKTADLTDNIRSDIIYFKGLSEFRLYFASGHASDRLVRARTYFQQFLEAPAKNNVHWAYYHLACIQAELSRQQLDSRDEHEKKARELARKALDSVRSAQFDTEDQKEKNLTLLNARLGLLPNGPLMNLSDGPVECPNLAATFANASAS